MRTSAMPQWFRTMRRWVPRLPALPRVGRGRRFSELGGEGKETRELDSKAVQPAVPWEHWIAGLMDLGAGNGQKWIINHLGPAAYGRWSDFFFSQRTENRSLQLLAVGMSSATMCNGRYPFNSPPRQKSQKPWVVVVIPCLCLDHINGRKALKIPWCFIEKTGFFCCFLLWPSHPLPHPSIMHPQVPSAVTSFTGGLPMAQDPAFDLRQSFRKFPLHRQAVQRRWGWVSSKKALADCARSSAKAIHF